MFIYLCVTFGTESMTPCRVWMGMYTMAVYDARVLHDIFVLL